MRVAGARVAASPREVFARAGTVIAMLINEAATDAVLGRGTPEFGPMVTGRTLVCMGSNAPGYSFVMLLGRMRWGKVTNGHARDEEPLSGREALTGEGNRGPPERRRLSGAGQRLTAP